MSNLRIPLNFDRLSDMKLIETGYFVHQEISAHTSVFTTPIPAMPAMKEGLDDFLTAVNAALGGGRVLVGQKNIARQKVVSLLTQSSHYVLMTANGDRQIALQSGFPLVKEPTPVVLAKPTDLQVVNGIQPGVLLVSVKKTKGAMAYLHQYTTDPLLNEETWMTMSCTAAKCKLEGLIPGTTYHVRVGAIGTKDQVLFSDVVSKKAS